MLNFLTHFFAFFITLVASFFLIKKAGGVSQTYELAALIFSFCLSFLFLASAIYHISSGKLKSGFKKLDHIAIFIMMLGIYTSLAIFCSAGNFFKIIYIIAIILLALFGACLKIFVSSDGTKRWSILMYIGFGASVFFLFPFLKIEVIVSLLFAGLFDLIGIYFYLKKDKEFTHAIWHIFSILAACFDWLAVWLAI